MADKPDDLSFEDAMERLETIVSSMEGGQMPLEEMVRSYEDGARLLRVCRARIDTARQRVEMITANLEGSGKASLSEFDADAAPDSEPARSRVSNTRRSTTKTSYPDDDEDSRLF